MKKLFSIILFTALLAGWNVSSAANCVINTSNTTVGVTPTNSDTVTQGVSYSQTLQIYVPATYSTFTVDSVHITSITGTPTGLTMTYNPVSQTINGGSNGSICFNGITNVAVGTYPLTFTGTIYTNVTSVPLSTLAAQFSYSFVVKAPQQQASSCDTLFSMLPIDTPEVFVFGQGQSGYLAGNNSYGDLAKAEAFSGPAGNDVTGAYIFFSVVTINAADSNQTIAVNLYDTTGTNGGPGNILSTTNVTLGSIARTVGLTRQLQQLVPLYVPFHNAPLAPGGSFLVGVILPTTTGDTVAIFSNSQTTHSGRGWEIESDGNWWNWDSVYTVGTPYHSGLFMAAITCPPAPPTAAFSLASATTCAGSAIQFNDQTQNGATSWNWTFANGTPDTSTAENPTVSYAAAGTYSIKLVVHNANGVDSITHTVVVSGNPSATASTTPATGATSATGSATITATGGAGSYTYVWSNGATGASITNVVPGTYMVTITDGNGCQYVDDTIHVTFTNGILQLNNGQQVKIYPNPTSNVLNLVWSQKSNAEVTVLDINGAVISTFATNGDTKSVCDVHALATGTYILRITDKSSNQQQSMLFSKF